MFERGEKELYRKVSVRTWNDDRVRRLSPLKPSGQALWLWLITGPFSTVIPGVVVGGRLAMAERLDWAPEDFDRCWSEIEAEKMAEADWKAPLVWMPNGIHHNEPDNPNVVTGWRKAEPFIPECGLRTKAFLELRSYLQTRGPAFVSSFDEGFAEGLPEGLLQRSSERSGDGSGNQEQEQEQYQEQEQEVQTGAKKSNEVTYEAIVDLWNESVGRTEIPRVKALTDGRREKLRLRRRPERDLSWWRKYFELVASNAFLRGENRQGWRASFDFVIRSEDVVAKILEGTYGGRERRPGQAVPKKSPYTPAGTT